jgi:hypothetical protein
MIKALIWYGQNGLIVSGGRKDHLSAKPDLPFTFDALYFEPTQTWYSEGESRRTLTPELQQVCEAFVDAYAFDILPEPHVHLVDGNGLYKGLGRPGDGIVVGPPPSDGVYRWDGKAEIWNRVMGADIEGRFVIDDVEAIVLETPPPPDSQIWWRWDELAQEWKDKRSLRDIHRECISTLMDMIQSVRFGILEQRGSQNYIYLLKEEEAAAYMAAGSPEFDPEDWPFLAADMAVDQPINPSVSAPQLALEILEQARSSTTEATDTDNVAGDVFEWLVDRDAATVKVKRNGTLVGTVSSVPTDPLYAYGSCYGRTYDWDFGQSGYVPSDAAYSTLCTANLPAPAVKDSSAQFQTELYAGTATASTDIAQSGTKTFSPDIVLLKNRDTTDQWKFVDQVRGATKELNTDTPDAEGTDANGLTAFNVNGFELGTGVNGYNDNTESFVAHMFNCGSSEVTNSDGTVDVTQRASAASGVSIGTFTTPASGSFTVGHGLSKVPGFVAIKQTDASGGWWTFIEGLAANEYLRLETTDAIATSTDAFDNALPTSSVVSSNITWLAASKPHRPVDPWYSPFLTTAQVDLSFADIFMIWYSITGWFGDHAFVQSGIKDR